jgi:hypothetical protein
MLAGTLESRSTIKGVTHKKKKRMAALKRAEDKVTD